jgi:hypothetical protein
MGYACPVCGDPQADAEHLANHLAFSAMLRDADGHESWLDEHVPDWADRDETGLADAVTDHAEPTEFPQVFEDTVDREHSHDHDDERSGALFDDDPDFAADAREKAASQRDLGDDAEDIVERGEEICHVHSAVREELHAEIDVEDNAF